MQHNPPPQRRQASLARHEAIAEALAQDIQVGTFAPRQWLKQIELKERYGAPRMAVRQALDRLVQARIIEHIPNRGYFVHARDGQATRDIQEIRLFLELAAAEGIVARATATDIAVVRELAETFSRLSGSDTVIELYDVNLAFHAALLALSPNKELPALIATLRGRVSSAPVSQWQNRARIEQSNREHFAMVEALANRDVEAFRATIRAHIALPDPL